MFGKQRKRERDDHSRAYAPRVYAHYRNNAASSALRIEGSSRGTNVEIFVRFVSLKNPTLMNYTSITHDPSVPLVRVFRAYALFAATTIATASTCARARMEIAFGMRPGLLTSLRRVRTLPSRERRLPYNSFALRSRDLPSLFTLRFRAFLPHSCRTSGTRRRRFALMDYSRNFPPSPAIAPDFGDVPVNLERLFRN